MSFDWVRDISIMHDKYGVKKWMEENKENPDKLRTYLQFRVDFLREELDETEAALISTDAEEIVDGLIDLCVVAIGTLDAFGINPYKAWDFTILATVVCPHAILLPDKVGMFSSVNCLAIFREPMP